ncbi:hypothetical protein BAY61_09745 [Prauserella marina]|nr:TetR/AcrR family transcriptional regulator C-terminal domain-containing protein [Prauserella marina]ASR35225.1 hypothetical protein BAY61_09745 [Prauserella marina]
MPPRAADRPSLSRERIIAHALELIDKHGIDKMSMRKLGAELGVDAMAIYYHLPDKAAVFDGVVEAVYEKGDIGSVPDTGSWREQLTGMMRRLRAVLREHPNTVPIVGTRPVHTPRMLAASDAALARLHRAGLPPTHSLLLFHNVRAYTIGHVLAEVGTPVGGPSRAGNDLPSALGSGYPDLTAAAKGGYHPDEHYESGLRALLDGYERMLAES